MKSTFTGTLTMEELFEEGWEDKKGVQEESRAQAGNRGAVGGRAESPSEGASHSTPSFSSTCFSLRKSYFGVFRAVKLPSRELGKTLLLRDNSEALHGVH